jgi:hypothetical protein
MGASIKKFSFSHFRVYELVLGVRVFTGDMSLDSLPRALRHLGSPLLQELRLLNRHLPIIQRRMAGTLATTASTLRQPVESKNRNEILFTIYLLPANTNLSK